MYQDSLYLLFYYHSDKPDGNNNAVKVRTSLRVGLDSVTQIASVPVDTVALFQQIIQKAPGDKDPFWLSKLLILTH